MGCYRQVRRPGQQRGQAGVDGPDAAGSDRDERERLRDDVRRQDLGESDVGSECDGAATSAA